MDNEKYIDLDGEFNNQIEEDLKKIDPDYTNDFDDEEE